MESEIAVEGAHLGTQSAHDEVLEDPTHDLGSSRSELRVLVVHNLEMATTTVSGKMVMAQNNDEPVRDLFLVFSHRLPLIIFLEIKLQIQ